METAQVTVSVDWLAEHINDDDVRVVDGSWHLPTANRDPEAEFLEAHIPGAVFFDLDKQSDKSAYLSHMMPIAMEFGRNMGKLGISEQHTIVVYDTTGMFSAARIWWMFRQFGADNVFVLDGGLPAWQKAGHAVESGPVEHEPTKFKAWLSDDVIVDMEDVKAAINQEGGPLLLDARDEGRFKGTAPEPKPNLRGGHMPGAINLPFLTLLDEERKLLPPEDLKAKFDAVGYHPDRPTIATCGSGVTACVILLALARLGITNVPLYDGSWSEWGLNPDTPVETG